MENVIVVLILVAIAAGIIWYLIRAKREGGEKCIGCPYAKQCGSKCTERTKINNITEIK